MAVSGSRDLWDAALRGNAVTSTIEAAIVGAEPSRLRRLSPSDRFTAIVALSDVCRHKPCFRSRATKSSWTVVQCVMSALGQKRTCAVHQPMSALVQKAPYKQTSGPVLK